MLTHLILPLTLLFTNPLCSHTAQFASAIASAREAGVPLESLTAIPITLLLQRGGNLPAALSLIEEISHFYALPSPSWELRIVEYERCLREKDEGVGNGRSPHAFAPLPQWGGVSLGY